MTPCPDEHELLEWEQGRLSAHAVARLEAPEGAAALGRLESRERNLLRLHHVHGLSMDAVGATYQAPRSTVARWIVRARERLLTLTREELTARLGLTPGELDSMLRLVCSQLDVSLRQLMTD
jgi:RNA polymerase sigma-70 factor (ECF subfamily)